jgi:hypothetical protein
MLLLLLLLLPSALPGAAANSFCAAFAPASYFSAASSK